MSQSTPAPSSPTAKLVRWLENFDASLTKGDTAEASSLFSTTGLWRDLIAFTWNIKTVEGHDEIRDMLDRTLSGTKPTGWIVDGEATADEGKGTIEGWLRFETALGRGIGHVRLVAGEGGGDDNLMATTLLTTLQELKGFEEKRGSKREMGVQHGAVKNRETWLERKTREEAELGYTRQPYCVIIGGGQGGLGLGARLKQLGVPTVILEKNARAGDSWRNRYKSLCLHDTVWYDHMPYLPFPDHWPVFIPKDKMGDWLEMYCKVMELNYWTLSECTNATYNDSAKEWTVHVQREGGKEVILKPKHLVFATGLSGFPRIPTFKGSETFRGDLHHSSKHPGGEAYTGKKCIVVGSNNSSFDICSDLWEHGADEVTMVQRSSSHVTKSETLVKLALSPLYSEEALAAGVSTEKADLIFSSIPYRIMPQLHKPMMDEIRKLDKDMYDGLAKAGFLMDYGDDETGLFLKYLRRGSGYYIDVGGAQLIIDKHIKIKSGAEIAEIKPDSVVFNDGSEQKADLVVLATGYSPMNGWVAKLVDEETADRVGKVWGYGSDTTLDPGPWEGEQRNMWKPTQHEALWFHGGNLAQSRHYSLFLALQLKVRMEGLPVQVYGLQKVYHTGR